MQLVHMLTKMILQPADGSFVVLDTYGNTTIQMTYSNSAQIPRHESNFMWARYKLIVEMAENCFWFWNATDDEHGTSMNRIAIRHPENYEQSFKKAGAQDAAQWTRVMTLPCA